MRGSFYLLSHCIIPGGGYDWAINSLILNIRNQKQRYITQIFQCQAAEFEF